MVAAGAIVDPAAGVDPVGWREKFDGLMARVAKRFKRVEPRRRARAFVEGLLADLPRKNCWTIAEYAGDATPDGMQHLLSLRGAKTRLRTPNSMRGCGVGASR